MLKRLVTTLGERSDYDAVSQCTRCGYCSQACPTYTATGRETFSGRGRNLIVRRLLEERFAEPGEAGEALSTCLLCGSCTSACPVDVPTSELVLEGRRLLRDGKVPLLMRLLTHLLVEKPRALPALLKGGYAGKRAGLAGLAARSGLLRLLGLRGLAEAALHVDEAPERFLDEDLAGDPDLGDAKGVRWAYFAACGPNYLLPRVGRATTKVMRALLGRGAYLRNRCCGLAPYNYGDLEAARKLARANIDLHEASGCPDDAAIVGDCSSCVDFMKNYPRLFLDDPAWRKRAERFSAAVRDAVELIPAEKLEPLAQPDILTYHDSCRARNGQGIVEQPRRAMRALGGEAFRELPAADACCGGAGAFAFSHPRLSDELLRRKISNIASIQARVVAASSTSCLIQLAHGLKKYYPEGRVLHLCELVAETLPPPSQAPR